MWTVSVQRQGPGRSHTPGARAGPCVFSVSQRPASLSARHGRAGTTISDPGRRGGNLRDYLASALTAGGAVAGAKLSGHGPVIDRPVDLITSTIAHRRCATAKSRRASLRASLMAMTSCAAFIPPRSRAQTLLHAATVEAHLPVGGRACFPKFSTGLGQASRPRGQDLGGPRPRPVPKTIDLWKTGPSPNLWKTGPAPLHRCRRRTRHRSPAR